MSCLYCGENPIPHRSFWLFESMDILLTPVRLKLAGKLRFFDPDVLISDALLLKFFKLLRLLRLARHNHDPLQAKNARARVLWQEAIGRNIPFYEIRPFGLPIDAYVANAKGEEILFFGLPRPQTSQIDLNLKWLDDKAILKQKLKHCGLPVPEGETFTRLKPALKLFRKLPKPVIVKPRKGSRGRHTTTYVYTEDQFRQAFKIAKQLCHWIIVEEQLFGDVFRGTTVNGKLVGVLGGSYPNVTGDGMHTIEQLIAIKNANKLAEVKDIKITGKTKMFLARQDKTLDSVLQKGEIINLSEKIGVNNGGTSYEVTAITHPDIKQVLEQAAKAVDSPILGFDFILPNITKSHKQQRMGIIECNGNPFINLHHEPLIGQPVNVAAHIWDLVS